MPGTASPCTKRQPTSAGTPGEAAVSSMGTGRNKSEATMMRRCPQRRMARPANGEASATAMVGALTVSAAAAFETANTRSSVGSSGWVA
ncbi:hypothetical protein PSR1_01517 [Anaeromyxobacter sp. PSR-1]|nr:hypothetical protein PSR1_01517 [Anaeromyxobacter sp. PSR-1]